MCGIVGIASTTPVADRESLVLQRDALRHRGPDDAGVWWSNDKRVGLAHRRLAILDLSPSGRQPMIDEDAGSSIIFNGEIYDFRDLRQELQERGYRFHSSSDTEVILAAYRQWGTDCLQHFNGMFAFALYDEERRRLFIARDRAGEKPLFYRVSNRGIEFASELKALMAAPWFPRRLDREALDCYLALGYVPGSRCILAGVNKLPAAHALTWDLETGQTAVWRYWQLPLPPDESNGENEEELVSELEYLLQGAVRRQLVADVPVGILLSGGVDSSLITALAARTTTSVKTFTICLPGCGSLDETEHARLIAHHFGTEHIELEAEPSTVELLPVLARQFDEPIVDSSMIPTYLVSKLVRQHCTVALGGDGGDELFGGYKHYSRLLRQREQVGWLPLCFRRAAAGISNCLLPLGFKGRQWLQSAATDFDCDIPLPGLHFDMGVCARLLESRNSSHTSGLGWIETVLHESLPETFDLLQRVTRSDFGNYLAEDILVKVDRASMANSLEVRAPWLDYRIIEFAFRKIPSQLKATPSERKILPKRLARRLLPPAFDYQRKQGFSVPLASWLRTSPWNEYVRQVLLDSPEGLFNKHYVAALLDGQARGRANSERLFALTLIELWRQEYRVTF